jgi:hypothetical protein
MTTTSEVGTPEKRGAGWFVPSGKVGYFVEFMRESRRWRCTCSGFRFRPHLCCKHIMAVRKLRKEAALG